MGVHREGYFGLNASPLDHLGKTGNRERGERNNFRVQSKSAHFSTNIPAISPACCPKVALSQPTYSIAPNAILISGAMPGTGVAHHRAGVLIRRSSHSRLGLHGLGCNWQRCPEFILFSASGMAGAALIIC
jgi:hypothetical protein